MRFSHPEILYALAAVAIPILIHLFNFRRYKKIWFSNIEFLKNISIETKKQNRLKHLLILLARILTVVFAVLAFAGPYFPSMERESRQRGVTFIALDNSYSMEAEGETGRLIDEARSQALKLINRSPKNEQFAVVSNNPGFGYHLLNRSEAALKLEKTVTGNHHGRLSQVIRQMNRIARKNNIISYRAFLFSDFQKNQIDIAQTGFDTASLYYFLPYRHTVLHNLYIDSCHFEEPNLLPGKHATLVVRVVNASPSPVEKLGIKLYIDNKQKALAGIDIGANDYTDVTLGFTVGQTGWHQGNLKIEDYPITFDDNLLFTFYVRDKIKVLEIDNSADSANTFLKTFYDSDSLFSYRHTSYRRLNRYRFNDFDLIILNGLSGISSGFLNMLKQYVNAGGNLTVIPPANGKPEPLNPLLKTFGAGSYGSEDTVTDRVATIKATHPVFKRAISEIPVNADFPVVFRHYGYRYSMRDNLQPLTGLLNGDPLVATKHFGAGNLFILTLPLNERWSNLSENPLFTVLFFAMATEQGSQDKPFYFMGKDMRIVLNSDLPANTDEALTITNKNITFIPMQRRINNSLVIDLGNNITKAGVYLLRTKDTVYKQLAFNANRAESEMEFYGKKELDSLLKAVSLPRYQIAGNPAAMIKEVINTPDKRTKLWKLFITFALLMLLAEILIIRFWK